MKHYRITLHKGACSLANELALLAAKSNGGNNITLNELRGYLMPKKGYMSIPTTTKNVK